MPSCHRSAHASPYLVSRDPACGDALSSSLWYENSEAAHQGTVLVLRRLLERQAAAPVGGSDEMGGGGLKRCLVAHDGLMIRVVQDER